MADLAYPLSIGGAIAAIFAFRGQIAGFFAFTANFFKTIESFKNVTENRKPTADDVKDAGTRAFQPRPTTYRDLAIGSGGTLATFAVAETLLEHGHDTHRAAADIAEHAAPVLDHAGHAVDAHDAVTHAHSLGDFLCSILDLLG